MISCASKACQEPPCTLVAASYPEGKEWRFCRWHFWTAVHVLLNRGAERVIVRYPSGSKHTPLSGGAYPEGEEKPE